jgi:putative peptide zinc metalloprotease protein
VSTARPRSSLVAAASREEAARALAERHGPPDQLPALRKDLRVRRQVQMGDVNWIVKNPETIKYFMFRDDEWQLIRLFDGTRTQQQILDDYNRRVRTPISINIVLSYEESLRRMQLLEQSVVEKSLALLDKSTQFRRKKAEQKSEGFNIFFIMFHLIDPDRFLTRTVKYVRWIWTPPVVAVVCAASLWTISVFAQHGQQIWSETLQLYKFVGKPLVDILQFFSILCIIGAIHEFAHGYVVKIYGGEVHDIGMALFYFTPVFYCETSDSFMFPNKWHKLWVTVAGIYVEAGICSAATLLWVASYPDTLLHQVSYKTMLLTGFATVFFNINPLIKVDGYNALASYLEMPGMREGSFRLIAQSFQKYILRLPIEIPPMAPRKKLVYWIYGTLSVGYTATIMLLIAGWVSNFYNKFFPDFAVIMILLTLYYIFRKRVRQLTRIGKLMYLDKRELVMSSRSRISLVAAAVAIFLILFVPWSRRTIRADAILRPEAKATLEAPEDAVVAQVLVREGDPVLRGQPIVQLVSPLAEEQERRTAVEKELYEKESSRARGAADAMHTYQAERRAASADVAWRSSERRREYLTLRSPIAGRVLTHRPEDLSGRFIVEGTSLVEIGDCRRMAADVGVSERLLSYLAPGASAAALVRSSPMTTRKGSVERISAATAALPPTVRDGKNPQAPSTVPERFVAVTVFENPDGELLPGAAAKVKIRSAREAYALRGWRLFWRWLRTIIW